MMDKALANKTQTGMHAKPASVRQRPEGLHAFDHVHGASDAEWDAFLAAHRGGHHEQTSEYGRLRSRFGYQCDRVVVRDAGRIIAGVQALAQATPLGRYAIVHRGPLAINDDPHVLRQVVSALEELARQRSYVSLRIDTFPTQVAVREALEERGFSPDGSWESKTSSVVIPLSYTDDEILGRMKPKGRYNLRVAQRAGVEVVPGDASAIDDFYELYRRSAIHSGFATFPRTYFDYLWQLFGRANRVRHFVAYCNWHPIAAIMNSVVNGHMLYCWGGIHRGVRERKMMANYLLHHQAMRWARDHGCSHYDLVGVTQFKKQLGCEVIQSPLPLRKFYGLGAPIRRMLMQKTWTNSMLRRGTMKTLNHMGLRQRMPW